MTGIDQNEAWNARYRAAGDDYVFGTEPNAYLARQAGCLRPKAALGKSPRQSALCVADGEGRNSVWLATHGFAVTAVDISAVAVDKARRLARERQVDVDFVVADILSDAWPPPALTASFDWVVGIFIQFVGARERARQFSRMKELTRPGGRILLQGYTPAQLELKTGGPSSLENLYTTELLREAFADWTIEDLVEYEEEIAEGSGHAGRSALIGLIARKP